MLSTRSLCVLSIVLGLPTAGNAMEEFAGTRFYFGELHAHTGLSGDGGSADLDNCNPEGDCGDLAAFFDTARYESGLDFCAITDHVNGSGEMDASGWPITLDLVQSAHDPAGGFVALLGAEVQYVLEDPAPLGHKNTLFFRDDVSDVPLEPLGIAGYTPSCDETWARIRELDATYGPLLTIPHHPAPAIPMPTDWSCHDQALSPVVEIYSNHGNSRDTVDVDSYDPPLHDITPEGTVDHALSVFGNRLGIIGGTDGHDTRPGETCATDGHNLDMPYGGSLTGLYFDESLSRTAIHDAIVARHTFATSGPKVPVLLTLVGGAGQTLAVGGDEVVIDEGATLLARLQIPVGQVQHVRNVELFSCDLTVQQMTDLGGGVYERPIESSELPWWGYGVVTLDGDAHFTELGIDCHDGGEDGTETIWTSPIWADLLGGDDDDSAGEEPPADDDTIITDGGCHTTCRNDDGVMGGGVAAGLLLLLGALSRRRMGGSRHPH